jgi:hypothetical protein
LRRLQRIHDQNANRSAGGTVCPSAPLTPAVHIPNARFIGYPSGGHLLVGRNAATSAEIVAFLRLHTF